MLSQDAKIFFFDMMLDYSVTRVKCTFPDFYGVIWLWILDSSRFPAKRQIESLVEAPNIEAKGVHVP